MYGGDETFFTIIVSGKPTGTVTREVSFAGFASPLLFATDAVFVTLIPSAFVSVGMSVSEDEEPGVRPPRSQVTVVVPLQFAPCGKTTPCSVTPGGSVSVTVASIEI